MTEAATTPEELVRWALRAQIRVYAVTGPAWARAQHWVGTVSEARDWREIRIEAGAHPRAIRVNLQTGELHLLTAMLSPIALTPDEAKDLLRERARCTR